MKKLLYFSLIFILFLICTMNVFGEQSNNEQIEIYSSQEYHPVSTQMNKTVYFCFAEKVDFFTVYNPKLYKAQLNENRDILTINPLKVGANSSLFVTCGDHNYAFHVLENTEYKFYDIYEVVWDPSIKVNTNSIFKMGMNTKRFSKTIIPQTINVFKDKEISLFNNGSLTYYVINKENFNITTNKLWNNILSVTPLKENVSTYIWILDVWSYFNLKICTTEEEELCNTNIRLIWDNFQE